MSKKRMGVLTGGGDCPGLNAAIRAVAKSAMRLGWEVIGICDGWEGLIETNYEVLDNARTSGIIDRGGTILGTSRVSPFYVEDGVSKVQANFKALGLEGLVVLGGDGTLSATARLAGMGLPAVGLPKTIDNDIRETDVTIGFHTAVQIATDALDRLRSTADAHHRVMLLEVMGRNAGWIATYSGMANGADAIIIPEVPLNDAGVERLWRMVKARDQDGKRFSLLVVAEGAEIHGERVTTHAVESGVANQTTCDVLARLIQENTGLECRTTTLGYVQRGGTPVAYDRILAAMLGVTATKLVTEGKFGVMAAVKGTTIIDVPLEKVGGGIKLVDPGIYGVAEVFFG